MPTAKPPKPRKPKPHDLLFTAAFEVPANAEALLRAELPAALRDAVDWTSLARDSAAFVTRTLGALRGDLVFTARFHDGIRIAFPIEHQSSHHRRMPLRFLGYNVQTWERHLAGHRDQPLPVIVPVLVAHVRGGWIHPRSLDQLFDPRVRHRPEIAAYLPRLLVLKFSALPPHYDARLVAASSEELDRYAERVLFATSLAAVFDE